MKTLDVFTEHGLDPQFFAEIGDAFVSRDYAANQVVFLENEPSSEFFLIESGAAIVSKEGAGGLNEPLGVLNKGACFGEMGLLENLDRSASVKAIGALRLHVLSKSKFIDLVKNNQTFYNFVKRTNNLRLLSNIPLFHDLDHSSLASLVAMGNESEYTVNQCVYKEGDPAAALYIVVNGTVKVVKNAQDGGEIAVAYLRTGDVFGKPGLIEQFPRSAAVVSTAVTKLLVLDRVPLMQLLQENKKIAYYWNKKLTKAAPTRSKITTNDDNNLVFRGMTIIAREERCVYCKACEIACAVSKSKSLKLSEAILEAPLPKKRINKLKTNTDDNTGGGTLPGQCRTCFDAPCLDSCKTHKAIRRDPFSRAILVIEEACIGCGLCVKACPSDVIAMIRSDGRKRRVALKCTLCVEHFSGPACVRICPTNALTIGLASLPLDYAHEKENLPTAQQPDSAQISKADDGLKKFFDKPAQPSGERRQHERLQYFHAPRISVLNKSTNKYQQIVGKIEDISSFGLLFITAENIELGAGVAIEFDIQNDYIRLQAKVMRVIEKGAGKRGIGVNFVFNDDDAAAESIAKLSLIEFA